MEKIVEPGTESVESVVISVLIPSWNGREHLEACLPALQGQSDPGEPWEILVHENGSTDDSAAWLNRCYPEVRLISSQSNTGFAPAVNELVRQACGDLVVLLNNDTCPSSDWLARLVGSLRAAPQDVAAVAGKMVDWDETRVDFCGGILTFDGHAFQRDFRRPLTESVDSADGSELLFGCGANMIVRRDVFLELGGFDESYFAYLEDVDFGWRVWSAGFRIIYCPKALVRHRGSASTVNLGIYRRGFLFERNALLTVVKNYDEKFWPIFMPAVLMTFQSRVTAMIRQRVPGGRLLLEDPYLKPLSFMDEIRTFGLGPTLRRSLHRVLGFSRWTALYDPLTMAQLRAQCSMLDLLDEAMDERARIQQFRRRSDAEIFERFPLHLVPTYPGDEKLFARSGFRACLPMEPKLVSKSLKDIMA